MLTGDSVETAVNTAIACRLTSKALKHYTFNTPGASPNLLLLMLESAHKDITKRLSEADPPGDFDYTVVVHGQMLYTIMDESYSKLRQYFLTIARSPANGA